MKGKLILVAILAFIISFLITNCAPTTPPNNDPVIVSYSPANNTENIDIQITLSWTA